MRKRKYEGDRRHENFEKHIDHPDDFLEEDDDLEKFDNMKISGNGFEDGINDFLDLNSQNNPKALDSTSTVGNRMECMYTCFKFA